MIVLIIYKFILLTTTADVYGVTYIYDHACLALFPQVV